MSLTGLDPSGMETAIGRLRTQANRLDTASDFARTGLSTADLSSDVVRRLEQRADRFRRIADELAVRVDIVTAYQIDPGSVDPALAAAAMSAGLESVDTLAELNHYIDNWNGTDNDPILDDLVRRRQQLLEDTVGDSTVDPFVAQVAEMNNISVEEAQMVVLTVEVEQLTEEMAVLEASRDDSGRWDQLDAQRNEALNQLLTNDTQLVTEVEVGLGQGTEFFAAISDGVQTVYGDSSILDLQAAMAAHSVDGSFGLALFDLDELHTEAVETFTGVSADVANPMIAGVAQSEGLAYNAIVEQLNAEIADGARDGDPLDLIPINGTIPNDATLLYNLSQQDLFEELETARQGDRSDYDGKMSLEDLQAVLDNPADFSAGAVAAATMLAQDFELRSRIDVAGSHQFLDGLAQGTHSFEGTDGIISQADVHQQVTNSLVYDLLAPHASTLDADDSGRITKVEFETQLAGIDPDGSLAAAINYALSDEAFDDRDRRSTLQQLGDGALTLGRLQSGLASPDEMLSFAQGLFWEFPKGLAVLAYDASSLVPGSPAYLIETHTDWGGDDHRGVALLTGLRDAGAIGLTLIPGTPQYAEEMERVRRSGRFSDHQGLGLITTVADWETFVDDPAQWFGTITGDVLLTAATGGYGGIATRGGSGLRLAARAGNAIENLGDLRHIRNLVGTKLDAARINASTRAAYLRTFVDAETGNLRRWTNTQLDDLAQTLFPNPALAGFNPTVIRIADRAEDGLSYATRLDNPSATIPGGGVAAHQGGNAIGHLPGLHVGRTLRQLQQRLRMDPDLTKAGSFRSLQEADGLVAQLLVDNADFIRRWLDSNVRGVTITQVFDRPVGGILLDGADELVAGDSVVLILRKSELFDEGYEIRTGFPEFADSLPNMTEIPVQVPDVIIRHDSSGN